MEIRAATADWHILRLSELICIHSPGLFVCIKCAHEPPPLTSTDRAQCISIQSVFPQTHEQTCSWSPVLALTVQIFSVWQRRLSHSFSLQQRLCNKPKSIFLNLFPPCVVLWDVWLVLISLLEVSIWEWVNDFFFSLWRLLLELSTITRNTFPIMQLISLICNRLRLSVRRPNSFRYLFWGCVDGKMTVNLWNANVTRWKLILSR